MLNLSTIKYQSQWHQMQTSEVVHKSNMRIIILSDNDASAIKLLIKEFRLRNSTNAYLFEPFPY